MCGIAGFFHPERRWPGHMAGVLQAMGESQIHRGPDDSGEYLGDHCGLSFRRLAIIDLASGHQPMFSPSGRSVLVFNGEIYNYRDLRRELQARGEKFFTQSDSEVILCGYETWGAGLLQKLRGIFAFALYDLERNELFVARDHTGVKPFYYTMTDGNFVFASEIKALLAFPGMSAAVRTSLLPKYLSFLWVPAPDTLFQNVFTLEPGHLLRVDRQGISKARYWQPDMRTVDRLKSGEEWLALLDGELQRCVREQMISDVPLGAFLSGGVDSTTVIAYMNGCSEWPVTTYTTGFSGSDLARDVIGSDLEYARLAGKRLKVDYHEIILDPDVVSLLPKLVWHMDEPIADPAAVTTFLICRAAKESCTVMLSGVGGDEIFGGYPRYRANALARRYQLLPAFVRRRILEPLIEKMPGGANRILRNLKKFSRSASLPFAERYLGYLSYYPEPQLRGLMLMDFSWPDIFAGHREILDRFCGDDEQQSMQNLDLLTFLPNLNLMYTDKMSSANAVEVRVPLLDHLLVEKMAALPQRYKIRGRQQKVLFKKLAETRIPREIVRRRKAGFGAPIGAWLKGQAQEIMLDMLAEETIKKRGYFKYAAVKKIIDDHLAGREYNANQLWQLMTLELWHQQFIDKK